jgi:hypothetical protein
LRGKRRVRLYLTAGPGVESTVEGILVGRWGGHYLLQVPRVIEAEGQTTPLLGHLEVPAERVLFVHVLTG